MFKHKVIAIVVTYNRKDLLAECISAILSQTFPIYQLIVIDNASTDGTMEMLGKLGIVNRADVIYKKLDSNLGGAGGFFKGLETAKNMDGDWFWLMDDDTIPRKDSLEKLINKIYLESSISFLASCVCGEHHEPMNVPALNTDTTENGYSDWYMNLENRMVKISRATFVSVLLNAEAVKKCGLPCRDYFIWGDDTEYTQRLTKYYGNAFLVGDSWVCHKRGNVQTIDIKKENDKNRLKNYFFFYRNTLINICIYNGKRKYTRRILRYMKEACTELFKPCGWVKFRVICKGIFQSMRDIRKFRRYIESQIKQG